MARLTDIAIRNLKKSTQDVLIAAGDCLFLRVRPSGSKRWIVRVKRNGRRRVHTIGSYPSVSIKAARAEAARIVAVERGEARIAVRDAVDEFMAAMIRPTYRRVANAEVYARRLQHDLGKLSLDAVRPVDVSRVITAYKRDAPVSAMRMLTFARQFFAWCVSIRYLERSPLSDVQRSAFGVKEESRKRTLSADEIRAFWNADDLPHRALLRFLLLTGLRIGEAQRVHASRLRDGWLDVPAELMKNDKPHSAYISELSRAQIEPDADPHLFRSVSPTAVQGALRRWLDRNDAQRWTPHDLRRTFASLLGDLGTPPHVIAKALSHTFAPSESLPTYLRSEWTDERKRAGDALAAHVAKLVRS